MERKPISIITQARVAADALLTDVIQYMTDRFGQSTTNFTVSSAYGQIIFVLANILQNVLFYIESSITELNINSATRPQNVYGLSTLSGHKPTRAIGATGTVSMYIQRRAQLDLPGGVIIVPNGTRLTCQANGMKYMVDLPGSEIRMPMDGSKNGTVINLVQGELQTQTFTGTGRKLQSVSVNFPQAYRIDNYRVDVYVNGNRWKRYEALYDMPYRGEGFLVNTSPVGSGIDIFFGTGSFGEIPQSGAQIVVEYLVTNGTNGNLSVSEGETVEWQWLDSGLSIFGDDVDLNRNLALKLVMSPDFGSDPESLDLTRVIAPRNSKSYVFANPTNYVTFFEKFNAFSIIDVYQRKDDRFIRDDKVMYALLVPDVRKTMQSNETYFTVPEERFRLTKQQKLKLEEMINRSGSKVVSTEISFVDVKFSRFVTNVAVILYEDAIQEVVKARILEMLSEYFISVRRRDRIPRSDLIKIIESIDGVDSVNVQFVSEQDETWVRTRDTNAGSSTADVSAYRPRIDEFGDINIFDTELPIIRGGWVDRNGTAYERSIDDSKPSAVNIIVKSIVPKSYNTDINRIKMDMITRR